MKFRMKTWLILVLLAALPWGLAAQTLHSSSFLPRRRRRSSLPSNPLRRPRPGKRVLRRRLLRPALGTPQQPPTTASTSPATPPAGSAQARHSLLAPARLADSSAGKSDNPDDTAHRHPQARGRGQRRLYGHGQARPFRKRPDAERFPEFSTTASRRRAIRSFSRETNLPLRVGLLIDASNSVRDRFKFEQEAAIEFLNQIIRPKFDKAFVIGFDTTPGGDAGLHRRCRGALARGAHAAAGRRHGHVRCHLLCLSRQADAGRQEHPGGDAPGHHSAERWRRQSEPRLA